MATVTGVLLGGRNSTAREILRSEWNYIVYDTEFGIILSTLCGSVALYDICILLTVEETSRWQIEGELFLNDLVKRVREDHAFVAERKLTDSLHWVFAAEL